MLCHIRYTVLDSVTGHRTSKWSHRYSLGKSNFKSKLAQQQQYSSKSMVVAQKTYTALPKAKGAWKYNYSVETECARARGTGA